MITRNRFAPIVSSEKHRHRLTVQANHLDHLGHVNHAIYLTLFEEARAAMVRGRGYGELLDTEKTGISPIVLEVNLKFRKELLVHQEVWIETQVISYERKIAVIAQEITDLDATRYCVAKFKFGLFDLKNRKLMPPTPDWLKALGISRAEKDS